MEVPWGCIHTLGIAKDALWPVKGPPFPLTGTAAIKRVNFTRGDHGKKERGKEGGWNEQ